MRAPRAARLLGPATLLINIISIAKDRFVTPRRIRVAGVRGDFLTPRGWPTPTDQWIRANTFWQPPEGWTPAPGLKPAPKGWRFWTPNKTWDIAARKYYAPLQGWMRASNIAAVACAVALVGATVLQLTILTLAAMLFLVIGLVCLIVFRARRKRMTSELLAHVTTGAERARNERLAREYQRYILDAS